MTREMIPLRDAIGRLADMHQAERDRIEAWADDVAPKIAAELGIPLDKLRPVLDAHLARHLAVISEMTEQDAVDLTYPAGRTPDHSQEDPMY